MSLLRIRVMARTRRMSPGICAVRPGMPMLREKLSLPAVAGGLPPMAWMLAAGLDAMLPAGAGTAVTTGGSSGRADEILTGGTVVATGASVGRAPMAGAVVGWMTGSGGSWAAAAVGGWVGCLVAGAVVGPGLGAGVWLGLAAGAALVIVMVWAAVGAVVISELESAVAARPRFPAVVS